ADPARPVAAAIRQGDRPGARLAAQLYRRRDRIDLDRGAEADERLLSETGFAIFVAIDRGPAARGHALPPRKRPPRARPPGWHASAPRHHCARPIRADDADALEADRGGAQLDLETVFSRPHLLARHRLRQLWLERSAQPLVL